MYTFCNSITILNYLKKEKYQKLPHDLFDRYLWLYTEIEELTHKLAYGKTIKPFNTYCYKKGTNILGVVYLCWENNLAELYIDSINLEELDTLLKNIFARKFAKLHITVGSKAIADYIQEQFEIDYNNGTVKYYATSPVEIKDERVKEMCEEDEYLVRKLSKNVWGSYKSFLSNGYRFFGLVDDDNLLSMCGVSQLTAFKSEIIGVETFEEINRIQGFSKATCSLALNETLKLNDVVTWSTNSRNISSCKTAESLGFKQYYTIYDFNYNNK